MLFQRRVIARAVDRRHALVVVREQQQRRGRGFGHAVFQRVGRVLLGGALRAQQVDKRSLVAFAPYGRDDRVEKDREIRPDAADRRSHRCEVASGRESGDADLGAGEAFGSRHVAAQDAQGLFGIFQRHLGVVVGHAVFQHCAGDAVRGEPLRHFIAFVVDGQQSVAASGADHDGLTGGFRRVGREDVEFGVGGVSEPVGLCFRLRCVDAVAVGRRGVVPDADRQGLPVVFGGSGCAHKQKCQEKLKGLFHNRTFFVGYCFPKGKPLPGTV